MLQKLFTFLILSLFIIAGVSQAQQPPPPVLGAGEHYTNLWSVSYDYQTNGSVRYLAQDPANPNNWVAIIMSQQDSTTAVGVQRYIYYAYSEDNGNTWASNVLDVSASEGFPCLTLQNNIPVIAAHRGAAPGSFVYKDLQFGGFSFEQITGVPVPTPFAPIWPHIAGTTNGNLIMAGSLNDGGAVPGFRTTYSGSWAPYEPMPLIDGPSGNYDVAAGPNGKVAIIGTQASTSSAFAWYESNDNGVTFNNGNEIFPYIIDGNDTLFAQITGGYQAVYDANGVCHIIFAAYNSFALDPVVVNTTRFVKPRIYHWNSQTSAMNIIASQSNIPNLTDTLSQALEAPLTQPTVTISSSGRLTCAFTTFLRGNTQVVGDGSVVNAGEIFASYSDNNGATWSTPKNITNTPNVEEKHSSLAPHTSNDSLRIYYVRDLFAGGWVNVAGWGKAPVYGIFQTSNLTGIRENVSIAKSFELFQNYPNPFNPTTSINYYMQKTGMVTLKVFDMLGREVVTLVNEIQTQGPKEITFNGSNLSSGIYYYSITAVDFKDTKKMMLIK